MPMRLFAILLFVCMAGCGPATFVVDLQGGNQELETKVVESDDRYGGDRIAIIDVAGMIHNGAKPGVLREGENPVSLLHEKLEMARKDSRVKAVILRLNTPGGTVTASDVMYRQVRRFRERSGKPVVALMMDVAASGGYYLACATDQVVAYPTTITASIGVIVQTISLQPGLSNLGITAEAITSGPNKDAGSPFSQLSDTQRAMLRQLVDDFYDRFVAIVREARPNISPEHFEAATDGRVVTGEQALAWGLIDHVGGLHDAADIAADLAGIASADLIMYHRPLRYVGSPYAGAPTTPGTTQINMAQINLDGAAGLGTGFSAAGIGVYYLWRPVSP